TDGARLADIWLDAAEFYTDLDPDAFRVPSRVDVERISTEAGAVEGTFARVAQIDGVVAGFVEAHIELPPAGAEAQFVAELAEVRMAVDALVVERPYWRRSVGGALLRAAEEWGRDRGATVVALDTYWSSPVSVSFYEKHMGYERRSISFRKHL
ncbi:MAG TPA: GNAT family N-acetyltransferase, partial [Actinomycetota bacterium]